MTQRDLLGLQDLRAGSPMPRTLTAAETAIIRTGWITLATIAVAALAMAFLAFRPWVDFGTTETSGSDVDVLTGVSDGYLVAGLAGLIFFAATGVLSRPRWTLALLPLIGASAVAVFTTACYSIAADWHAAGVDESGAFIVRGDPTVVPYLIAGLAVAIGVLASILAAFRASRTR